MVNSGQPIQKLAGSKDLPVFLCKEHYAFASVLECYNLETLTLGSGVTEIGQYAFEYCKSLKSIYCKATTPPRIDHAWDLSLFRDSNCKVYVPRNSVEAYKSADGWSGYAEYADDIVGYDF